MRKLSHGDATHSAKPPGWGPGAVGLHALVASGAHLYSPATCLHTLPINERTVKEGTEKTQYETAEYVEISRVITTREGRRAPLRRDRNVVKLRNPKTLGVYKIQI